MVGAGSSVQFCMHAQWHLPSHVLQALPPFSANPLRCLQLRLNFGDDLARALGDTNALADERFAPATKAKLACQSPRSWLEQQVTACLARLPYGRWPAVEEVCCGDAMLPVCAAPHVARLCPWLFRSHNSGAELAAAFEGLTAAGGTLEVLYLNSRYAIFWITGYPLHASSLENNTCDPTPAQRMAAALARLRSLQQLDFAWASETGPFVAAEVLAGALPSPARTADITQHQRPHDHCKAAAAAGLLARGPEGASNQRPR